MHTGPFIPAPRAFACLFTGLGLALAATGASVRWAVGCALLAAATLQPVGYCPTEYLQRLGGAWVAFVLGLCLRNDLLPDVSSMGAARWLAVVATVVFVSLPAAFPEVAGVRNTIHQPLRGCPAVSS